MQNCIVWEKNKNAVINCTVQCHWANNLKKKIYDLFVFAFGNMRQACNLNPLNAAPYTSMKLCNHGNWQSSFICLLKYINANISA